MMFGSIHDQALDQAAETGNLFLAALSADLQRLAVIHAHQRHKTGSIGRLPMVAQANAIGLHRCQTDKIQNILETPDLNAKLGHKLPLPVYTKSVQSCIITIDYTRIILENLAVFNWTHWMNDILLNPYYW